MDSKRDMNNKMHYVFSGKTYGWKEKKKNVMRIEIIQHYVALL